MVQPHNGAEIPGQPAQHRGCEAGDTEIDQKSGGAEIIPAYHKGGHRMKYVYPAILTPEDGGYIVTFPDLENCFTDGSDLCEAVEMAQDVLNLMLKTMEDEKQQIPAASNAADIRCEDDAVVTLVSADTAEYRKKYGNYAVKKTLSIPAWLNTVAEEKGVNVSATLQEALRAKLEIA